MRNVKQIRAWQNVTAMTITVTGSRPLDVWSRFVQMLTNLLNVEPWSLFRDVMDNIGRACCPIEDPTARLGGSFGSRFTPKTMAERRETILALEQGVKSFGLTLGEAQTDLGRNTFLAESVFTLAPCLGVQLLIRPMREKELWRDGLKSSGGLVVEIRFENSECGTKFREEFDKTRWPHDDNVLDDNVLVERVVWEDVLYLQAFSAQHWLFAQGSRERLGERVSVVESLPWGDRYGASIYRVAPLEGEELVVYRASRAVYDLGLGGDTATGRSHTDEAVFATVGPFSLALRKGERHRGQPSHDRIAVFQDATLPFGKLLAPKGEFAEDGDALDEHWDGADDSAPAGRRLPYADAEEPEDGDEW